MRWVFGLVLVAAFAAVCLYLLAESEVIEVTTTGPSEAELASASDGAPISHDEVRDALVSAGLNEAPVLGDTGVAAHMKRLKKGQISAPALLTYARNLSELRNRSEAHGRAIPSSFWDVETPALTKDGWTAFAIVAHMASARGRPYFDLLSQAYGRFYEFRSGDGAGDTALDAAFDILEMSHAYILAVPDEQRLQHGAKLQPTHAATLMIWQTVVAGSTRRIPGLGKPAFDHGFVGRFNVRTIYQYDVGTALSFGKVWGTSGFADRFVGPPENDNQIEHLTISALLQSVAQTPVSVLDALEIEKAAIGKSSRGEAAADIALNNAIRNHFVPLVAEDFGLAVDSLKQEMQR